MTVEYKAMLGPIVLERGNVLGSKIKKWTAIPVFSTNNWEAEFGLDAVSIHRSGFNVTFRKEQINIGPLKSPTNLLGVHLEFSWRHEELQKVEVPLIDFEIPWELTAEHVIIDSQ